MTTAIKNNKTKEKIANWLSDHGLALFVEPGLTFGGAVTASMKMGFELVPARWSEKQLNILADKLAKTVDISVQEYFECLSEEISGKTDSQIEEIITRITQDISENHQSIVRELQSIKERPVWPLQQFKETPQIARLLKFHFVGRDREMSQLWRFLRGDKRFGILVGEGGVGKTRLAIEFADLLDKLGDWKVYFMRPYVKCSELPRSGNVLLILEDTVEESCQDNLMHLVSDLVCSDCNVKVLLVSRPLFKDSIVLKLQRMYQDFDTIDLKGGDITKFLLANYPGIPGIIARQIESQCQQNFVYAAIYAELHRTTRDVPNLQKVLAQTVAKLVSDVARRVEKRPEDIKNIIAIISVIAPVDWQNDKNFLKRALSDNQFSTFGDIISLVDIEPLEFLYNQDERYFIKPDPVADFLTSQLINDKTFTKAWKKLVKLAPYRVTSNLGRSIRFDQRNRRQVLHLLNDVWDFLNNTDCNSFSPEYFKAIALLAGYFRHLLPVTITTQHVTQWKRCYEILAGRFQNSNIADSFGGCLLNATYYYGDFFSLDDAEYCLALLKDLSKRDSTAVVRFAEGLVNTIFAYGKAGELKQMENCLNELTDLCKKYQEKRLHPLVAMALHNAAIPYGKSARFKEMQSHLNRLKALCDTCQDTRCDKQYSLALRNAVSFHKKAREDGSGQVEAYLDQLALLYAKDPGGISNEYAQALADAIELYDLSQWQQAEQCLIELRKLHSCWPTPSIRYAYVSGLTKTAIDLRTMGQPRIERLVELYKLRYYYPVDGFPTPKFLLQIEDFIIWEITEVARSNFQSNKAYLKKCILRLRDILGDDVEIELLRMKVEGSSYWQSLNPKIQNYLHGMLESGEEKKT